MAEPSFSYTAPKTVLKTQLDDPEDNPFTLALKEAARRAIMNRIEELQAKISPQKRLTGRQMKQTTTALKYVSAELRANKEFILEQVRKDPKALQHADEALKNDFQVVMAAVEQNGLCLELASKEMRNNDKIVMAAVRQRGRALKFASDPMKDNMDVVKAAVEKDGDSLFFASDRLKRDREIALAALKSDGNALQHLSADLRKVCFTTMPPPAFMNVPVQLICFCSIDKTSSDSYQTSDLRAYDQTFGLIKPGHRHRSDCSQESLDIACSCGHQLERGACSEDAA